VKAVGPRRYELLKKLGVRSVADLLLHLPRTYEESLNFIPISQVKPGALVTIRGRILDKDYKPKLFGKSRVWVLLADDSGEIEAVWFDQSYRSKQLSEVDEVTLSGKARMYEDKLQLIQPKIITLSKEELEARLSPSAKRGQKTLLPLYPTTSGLGQETFRRIERNALEKYADEFPEIFSENFRKMRQFLPIEEALRSVHFPPSLRIARQAKRRLAYEEFFLLEVAMALRRRGIKEEHKAHRIQVTPRIDQRIRRLFPFKLTSAQDRAISEIAEDLQHQEPMNRLLQGDVGSGKTVVAVYALLAAVANKLQVALMAPTEILAEQHHNTLSFFLREARVRMKLLTGGISRSQRNEALSGIRVGEVDLAVGTHALVEEDVDFKRLGLLVVDEQHKFGVVQRARLRQKGLTPDCLVMTATPIPRTLALTVFGDLDVSVIDELPPGRVPIKTHLVPPQKRERAYEFIRKEINKGRQAYIVYPLISESDAIEAKAATEMADFLAREVFSEFKVALLTGRMPSAKKEEVMLDFRTRKTQILVSTVVIEVGIDVPNATIMVIENAERFGLAALHQLRGRIGRGRYQSFCLLFGEPKTDEARRRLQIMTQTTDGFSLAEEDLKNRGPGEFFGIRQHGMPELKIANLIEDYELLRMARKDAFSLVKADPYLSRPENFLLSRMVRAKFAQRLDLVNVG